MELANIEKLVQKYLEAETSLQEETTLRDYFASNNVAPHLAQYSMLFNYFNASKDETFTKTIQLEPKKSKRRNFKWLSVAASVALLFSMYVGNNYYQEQKARKQYAQVAETLKLISSKMQKGNEAMGNLYAYEDSVKKIFKTK